jgi:hypothetical protein
MREREVQAVQQWRKIQAEKSSKRLKRETLEEQKTEDKPARRGASVPAPGKAAGKNRNASPQKLPAAVKSVTAAESAQMKQEQADDNELTGSEKICMDTTLMVRPLTSLA